jgi:hypothetical protein
VSPPRFEDLFEQADVLLARGGQADLRRAISAAYYGLFHFALTEAADMVVGKEHRSSARYSLVYRSIDTTAISMAREAITWFQQGTKEQQRALLTLLLFKPR